jgi:hypothetical protein
LQVSIQLLKIGYRGWVASFPLGALIGEDAVQLAGHFGVGYFAVSHDGKGQIRMRTSLYTA